jgi:two-component system chemotaxis response regulator CheY
MAPKSILIVDDGTTIRLYYASVLSEAGFDIHQAVNGFEGLEACLTRRFDLMLVDVNMPKMDGYELVARLRGDDGLKDMPIVMISTESAEQDAEKAYRCGSNLYLFKPVAPDELVATARLMTGLAA